LANFIRLLQRTGLLHIAVTNRAGRRGQDDRRSKMNKLTLTAALLATAGVASAEPFDGPFVGVQAGWEQADVGTASTPLGDLALGRSNDTVTGGLFAGYDYKLTPRIVAGVEAGINLTDSDDLARTAGGTTVAIDPERSLDLTARLGYLATDTTLVYARGGYSNLRAETVRTTAAGTLSDTGNRDGWLLGAGVERTLSDTISTRLEYRYTDLSEGDGKFDRHQLLVGVAYRF
jgi:outer membrane immunogenic protein